MSPPDRAAGSVWRSWQPSTWEGAAFLLLLTLHLGSVLPFHVPILFADEVGYLENARRLAWMPPYGDLNPAGRWPIFYHAGYSFLIAPAYPLLSSMEQVYMWSLGVNAVLAALLLPLLRRFCSRALGLERGRATLVAFASCLYPTFALTPKLAWAESLIISGFVLLSLAVHRTVQQGSVKAAAVLGLLSGCCYLVHPRLLPLSLLAAVLLVGLALARKIPGIAAMLGCGVLGTLVLATRALHGWLGQELYGGVTGLGGTATAILMQPGRWRILPISLAGEVWYLTAGSFGAVVLGTVLLCRMVVKPQVPLDPLASDGAMADRRRLASRVTAAWLLVSAGGLLLLSSLFIYGEDRVDRLLYGRYVEGVLAPVLAAGLAWWWSEHRRTVWPLAAAFAVLVITGLALRFGHEPEVYQAPLNHLNIMGLSPFWEYLRPLRPLLITALAGGMMLALFAVARWRPGLAVAGSMAGFLVGAFFLGQEIYDAQLRMDFRLTIPEMLTASELPPVPVAYDVDSFQPLGYFSYTFLLDRFPVEPMDMDGPDGDTVVSPLPSLVVSRRSWPLAGETGARLVVAESFFDQALWVLPGQEQELLARRGLLFPETPWSGAGPDGLDPASARGGLRWAPSTPAQVTMSAHGRRWLQVDVEHRGVGQVWWPLETRSPEMVGAVRLAAYWIPVDDAGSPVAVNVADLPAPMRPGEEQRVPVVLRPVDAQGDPLSPGDYILRVKLVQEGSFAFEQPGKAILELPVTLR